MGDLVIPQSSLGGRCIAVLVMAVPTLIGLPRSAFPEEVNSSSILYSACPDERSVCRNVRPEVMTVAPDGSNIRRLTFNDLREGDVAVSPTSDAIAFVAHRPNSDSVCGLFLARLDAPTRELLATDSDLSCEDNRFSWSPDGSSLAFAKGRTLTLVNVETHDHRVLVSRRSIPNDQLIFGPQWSPEGDAIYFAYFDLEGNVDGIFKVEPDGSGLTELARIRRLTFDFALSPDGRHIAFESDDGDQVRFGVAKVFVIDTSSEVITQLASGRNEYSALGWSPDSEEVAFLSRDYVGDTYMRIFNIATGVETSTFAYMVRTDLTWSPDGTRLAFVRYHPSVLNSSAVATWLPDGKDERVLTPWGQWTDIHAWLAFP